MDLAAGTADIVEIRLDYISELNDRDLMEIISGKKCPLIMTCRKPEEGGQYAGSEGRRIEILKRCAELGADHVDIEMSSGRQAVEGAIAAGQVGPWNRDLPLSYIGQNEFLTDILGPLSTAEKVTE